jgi:hypothetical protein
MALLGIARYWGVLGTTIWLAACGAARADWFDFCTGKKCPPAYVHCSEGPPKLKFKCACPKPVCGPCEMKKWGYYENCWQPWPGPPNTSRCFNFPPHPGAAPAAPAATLHSPRPLTEPASP